MDVLQNDFRKEYEKELQTTLFPTEKISENVIGLSFAMMNAKSIGELGLTAQGLKDLRTAISKDEISLYQMSFIINNVPNCSPDELGVTIDTYIEYLIENDEMGKVWNEVALPLKNKLVERLNRESLRLDKKNGKNVNPENRKR